jgi:PAS domain S-box-containing protein
MTGQTSIRRKLTFAIMTTSITVLLLTGAGFISYEIITFQRWLENYISTVGEIIAQNSTSALSFNDEKTAHETLSSLSVDRHITGAALYNRDGRLFAHWPTNLPASHFPERARNRGFNYEMDHVIYYTPVVQANVRQGTLYLRSDLGARQERYGLYASIVAVVLGVSLLVALVLAHILQKGISQPLLALADTAKTVSTRRDYSIRAIKFTHDEVGALTDAFNHMLTQIQERDAALRHNEERFRQLANAVPAIVWTSDSSGSVFYFNEQWYEYTGRSPSDSLGFKWTQAIHPDDRDECLRVWHQAIQSGKIYEAEVRVRRADGEYRWFLSRAHPARDGAGNIANWFATSTDIEEKKRAEENINTLNLSLEQRVQERTAELETSNRELEAFSYSVAHDLRAPLRSIDGFNQALLEDHGKELGADAQELLQRARQASQRMSQLIDDLLNLSRVARAEMRRQKVNLSEIAAGIAAELQKAEPERTVNLTIEPGILATGDDRLLRLVLENLVGNAFKFTRKKPVANIEFGRRILDGRRVLFIRDNGAGFNMQYAGKLFGPFQRLHAATEYPGTGIGLATVHRILARHGGRIWPESVPNEGTTFYFTLPE